MRDKPCFSCSALVPDIDGPVHRYMSSSPGCWAAFGEVLAREYTDARYGKNHRLTVDSYAVQHPGTSSQQSISSVAVHLASLNMVLENNMTQPEATKFIQEFVRHKHSFYWLEPPADLGKITVRHVLAASSPVDHLKAVEDWARAAWSAWAIHHAQIKLWMETSSKTLD